MIISRNLEKEYPEPPECELNSSQCEFDVECICHDCGRHLCRNCATYIRHQPRLVKYVGNSLADSSPNRGEAHCDKCKQEHVYFPRNFALGSAMMVMGVVLVFFGSNLNLVANLLDMLPTVVGGALDTPQLIIEGFSLRQLVMLGVSALWAVVALSSLLGRDFEQLYNVTLGVILILTLITVTSIPALAFGWVAVFAGYGLILSEYRLKKPVDFSLKQVIWNMVSRE